MTLRAACTAVVIWACTSVLTLHCGFASGIPPYVDSAIRKEAQPVREALPGQPLFVFATIADSHIRLREPWDDLGRIKATSICRELLANYVRDVNAHNPRVDFAVHLGDITDYGLPEEFEAAKAILDSLQCPLYPVVGNHDVLGGTGKTNWRTFAGRDSTNYTFDHKGFHFVVIDCTPDSYGTAPVACDRKLRNWVEADLSVNSAKPVFVLSHYNMWARQWGPTFDGLSQYAYEEYEGMPELRKVLEDAANVVAVINGHVHANRAEVHNGIYYIDIGATLVGKPSIRYFYAFAESVVVRCEYISDSRLASRVSFLCSRPRSYASDPKGCKFIDGAHRDREFTVPVRIPVSLDNR